jgi:hypothetical protein
VNKLTVETIDATRCPELENQNNVSYKDKVGTVQRTKINLITSDL